MQRLRHNLKGIYTVWLRDILRFIREPARIAGSLGGPMLYLFVLGGGLSSSLGGLSIGAGGGGAPFDFRQFLFPGVLGMTVLFTSVFSAISIVWDREFGFLKEVMVAPISRTAVALGKIAGGSTQAMIQAAVVLALAPAIGVHLGVGQVFALLGLLLVVAAVLTTLGVVIAARQHSTEGFQFVMQFLVLPMFFLSGALFPLRNLPTWLSSLSTVDPLTYGVDALRRIALGATLPPQLLGEVVAHPLWLDLAILGGFGLALLIPAVWLFNLKD
jgi:ABC-2 type transport system permease protein